MKILILSPTPYLLIPTIASTGDEIVGSYAGSPDLVVSYNHRLIVRAPDLHKCTHINLHISLLPWNRGADPNFWSWFDGTPKGVSIHYMDSHLDTGPLLAQRQVSFVEGSKKHTLRTSYDTLHEIMLQMFKEEWSRIRCLPGSDAQPEVGSYHRSVDKDPFFAELPLGWDTPVSTVEELGRQYRRTGAPCSSVSTSQA